MVTRSQKIRLGIFLAISAAALIGVLVAVLAPRYLEERDHYYIGFRDVSVTGLLEGGTVKYHGLNVGNVSRIFIDPQDIRRVIVEVSLNPETPIKADTQAEINFLGITGIKVIELRAGTPESEMLPPGSFIQPGISIADEITGKAEVIADKAERVLNNVALMTDAANRDKLRILLDNTNQTLGDLHGFLAANNETMSRTLANSEVITAELRETAKTAKLAARRMRTLAESDSVDQIIGNMARFSRTLNEADLLKLIRDLNQTLDRTNSMLKQVERRYAESEDDLAATIAAARETLDNLNQFSRQISDDPSILVRGGKAKDAPDYHLEK